MSWPVFIVKRTLRCRHNLRRYAGERSCAHSGLTYCNAEVLLADDAPAVIDKYNCVESAERPPSDDPRWPVQCACGYRFVEEDNRQVFVSEYYAAEDGRRWAVRDLPPGAMYDSWWGPEKGPNGEPWWVLVLPPGGHNTWDIYGPASNSKTGWTITGTAPKLTASPSILVPRYHGWLRDGVLTDDCEGRTYG